MSKASGAATGETRAPRVIRLPSPRRLFRPEPGLVLVAATLIGDLSRIGLITQAFDRGTVLGPQEPGQLLMGVRQAADEGAAELPDDAEVCACAGVSAGRIRGCSSLADVKERTRATTGCGGCVSAVTALLQGAPAPVSP